MSLRLEESWEAEVSWGTGMILSTGVHNLTEVPIEALWHQYTHRAPQHTPLGTERGGTLALRTSSDRSLSLLTRVHLLPRNQQ